MGLLSQTSLRSAQYSVEALSEVRSSHLSLPFPDRFSVSSLAPGAASLIKPLTDPTLPHSEQLDISKTPRDLNVAEWTLLIRAFDCWPFAPEVRPFNSLLSVTEKTDAYIEFIRTC